jgi:hypothetical protein
MLEIRPGKLRVLLHRARAGLRGSLGGSADPGSVAVTCAAFVELVTAHLDGVLDRDTEQRLVEHMAICDGCDRYLEQIRETVTLLGLLPTEATLSGEVRDHLLAVFRSRPRG